MDGYMNAEAALRAMRKMAAQENAAMVRDYLPRGGLQTAQAWGRVGGARNKARRHLPTIEYSETVLRILGKGPATVSEVCHLTGKSKRQTQRALYALRENGKAGVVGETRTGPSNVRTQLWGVE